MTADHAMVLQKIGALFDELIAHDGYGELRIEVRILKRGQKEVILHCGKQYRYVVDCSQKIATDTNTAGGAGPLHSHRKSYDRQPASMGGAARSIVP